MGTLSEDMNEWKDELFTKRDLRAGFKLLIEITGGAGLLIGGIAAATSVVPFLNALGIPITMGTAHLMLREGAKAYEKMDTDQRKAIRAVASFVHGGFSLNRFQ